MSVYLASMFKYMTDNPVSFALFGIAVNRAFVASLATTAVGSMWAWISPYLSG